MSRNVVDDSYYTISHGGKVPLKWTTPEVNCQHTQHEMEMVLVS